MPRTRRSPSAKKSNFAALSVTAASLAVTFCCFDPVPAGEDIVTAQSSIVAPADVPLPPDAIQTLSKPSEQTKSIPQENVPLNGILLDNNEAITFSLLLLEDGARFLRNIDNYTVVFNKQERIGGDLSKNQIIELKVRHEPSFSVYMKWKNGDTGRQVLYNEDYEDKKMVVKLGGLKGRLLPAIKLDPVGAEAMAEARYPVTQAGLLGMAEQIIAYRRDDLKSGEGVTCVRLPNQVVDERNCYCFQYDYASPEFNKLYRKSLVMIDMRYHVPMQVVNYTWTNEVEGMSTQQMDEATLIENYSFSRMDFGKNLVAEEFSRDNPSYRM